MSKLIMQLGNFFVELLLRSPLHQVLSKDFALISVTGRNSGKVYTTPINYLRLGKEIRIFSRRQRRWWRNLRNGAEVRLLIAGKTIVGTGRVIDLGQAELRAALQKSYPMLLDAQIAEMLPDTVMLHVQVN